MPLSSSVPLPMSLAPGDTGAYKARWDKDEPALLLFHLLLMTYRILSIYNLNNF
jgi:hypothetical protein